MIEYVQAFALFALLAFAIFAEKTMRSRIEELPDQTEVITDKITRMTEVLDDIADLLNEALHAVGSSPLAQTPSSPVEAILNAFIGNMTSKANHGPQENQRTIHEIDPTPQEQTEIVNQ
jgi:hypothetical protein